MRLFAVMAGIAAGLYLMSAPLQAQDAPEIRQFDVPMLEKLGRDIYRQDQAAWHATDALRDAHTIDEMRAENVRGWIVEDKPEGALVRFMRDGANGLEAAYDISYASGKPVLSVPSDRNLTETEKAQFLARTIALKSMTQMCGDNYNTIALKDPEGDGWLVWVLAALSRPGEIMATGHVRFTMSADGSKIVRRDALSRGCESIKVEKGMKLLMMSQIVSNLPLETYVFLSLQHRIPMYIVSPDKSLWRVIEGKITQIQEAGAK